MANTQIRRTLIYESKNSKIIRRFELCFNALRSSYFDTKRFLSTTPSTKDETSLSDSFLYPFRRKMLLAFIRRGMIERNSIITSSITNSNHWMFTFAFEKERTNRVRWNFCFRFAKHLASSVCCVNLLIHQMVVPGQSAEMIRCNVIICGIWTGETANRWPTVLSPFVVSKDRRTCCTTRFIHCFEHIFSVSFIFAFIQTSRWPPKEH